MEYRIVRDNTSLEHHGIIGQKWGIRRFQNADGSLTPEGRARYGSAADFDGDTTEYKSHLSVQGQRWGRRKNQSYQGNSKYLKKDQADRSAEIRKQKREEQRAKRKAEKEAARKAYQEQEEAEIRVQEEREAIAKEIDRLSKMNPRYLTDSELRRLNERKRAEDEFKRNYQPDSMLAKKGKEYALQAADSLIRQVAIPALVATGKAQVHKYVKEAIKSGDLPEVYADIIEKEFAGGGGKKKGSPSDSGGKKKKFKKK